MACGPPRCATCNGSRSSCPRAACTFTASRTAFPVCIRSAVMRCGLSASYDASTLRTPTYSSPSAADQSAPSASTGSSSASGRPPRCHSRSTPTCCAMPVGSNSRTMAMTPGPCSTTSGTRTSSTRSDTPKWRPTGSRTFGGADLISRRLAHLISRLRVNNPSRKATVGSVAPSHLAPCLTRWRREGWHRLGRAVYHLGIGCCVALGNHLFYELDRALDLLVAHRLDAAGMLQLHLPRHQQDKQFQKYRRLVPHHLIYRLATALPEGGVHFPDGVGVKRMTRAMDVAGSVSRHPRSKLSVCGARYLFLGSVSHSNTTPSNRGLG